MRITLTSHPDARAISRVGDTGDPWSFEFNINCYYPTFRHLLEYGVFFTIANASDRELVHYDKDGSGVLKWSVQFVDEYPARSEWRGVATFASPNSDILHVAAGSWGPFFREDNITSLTISDRRDAIVFAYCRRNRDALIRAGGAFFHVCGFRLYSDASSSSEAGNMGGPKGVVSVESKGSFDPDTVMGDNVSDDKAYDADHSDLDSDGIVGDEDMDSSTADGDNHPCTAVDEPEGQPCGLDRPVSLAEVYVAFRLMDLRYGKGRWKASHRLISETPTHDSGLKVVE